MSGYGPTPSESNEATAGEPKPKVKKQYVRKMTEKRRESNRKAQRALRERRKQRITVLEERIENANSKFRNVTATIISRQESIDVDSIEESPPQCWHTDSMDFPSGRGPGMVVDFDKILQSNGDIAIPQNLQRFIPLTTRSPSPATSFVAQLPLLTASHGPNDSQRDNSRDNLVPYSWPMPPNAHSDPYNPPTPLTFTNSPPPFAPYFSGSLSTTSRRHAYTHQLRALNSQSASSSSWPLNNTLTPGPYSAINASLALASMLQISRTAYLTDAPSIFPSCFLSLLTSPTGTAGDYSHNPHYTKTYLPAPSLTPAFAAGAESAVLERVKRDPEIHRRFDEHAIMVPEALRPRPVQYTRAHPSYLDCIVWPGVRQRVVQASVKGELDHVEFFLDLMHGGMVCWGSDAGSGDWGQGVPWSTRSWEAKGWFLRKWMWLIGSEEEEMLAGDGEGVWSSSRWWWGVRAEREGYGFDEEDGGFGTGAASREWAEGQVQELSEGAWQFETEQAKKAYVPMSGMH